MLTVQEIQAISFEKAVFGGYDQKAVDDFVEEEYCAGDHRQGTGGIVAADCRGPAECG